LITGSYWSVFYLVHSLSERIIDSIIVSRKEDLKADYEKIQKKIESKHMDLGFKITLLEKLYEHYKTDDLNLIISSAKLLKEIRNKFMFHPLDYDDYSFIYELDEISKKDDLVENLVRSIKETLDNLLALIKTAGLEKNILQYYSKSFGSLISLFSKNKSSSEVSVSYSNIFRDFPRYFTELSYVFILILGREDLNLFG